MRTTHLLWTGSGHGRSAAGGSHPTPTRTGSAARAERRRPRRQRGRSGQYQQSTRPAGPRRPARRPRRRRGTVGGGHCSRQRMLIGAHVREATTRSPRRRERGAEIVQFFLADPQGWKKPPDRTRRPTRAARGGRRRSYVHAPYVVNVASPNNRIRIPSRKLVDAAREAAAEVGATGWSCTAGTSPTATTPRTASTNWRKFLVRQADEGGFAGADPDREHRRRRQRDGPAVRRAGPALGRGRRVRRRLLPGHLPRARRRGGAARRWSTGSRRSPAGSTWCTSTTPGTRSAPGADRHANIGDGHDRPGPRWSAVCAAAGRPGRGGDPGGEGQAADIAFLRERLGS